MSMFPSEFLTVFGVNDSLGYYAALSDDHFSHFNNTST